MDYELAISDIAKGALKLGAAARSIGELCGEPSGYKDEPEGVAANGRMAAVCLQMAMQVWLELKVHHGNCGGGKGQVEVSVEPMGNLPVEVRMAIMKAMAGAAADMAKKEKEDAGDGEES